MTLAEDMIGDLWEQTKDDDDFFSALPGLPGLPPPPGKAAAAAPSPLRSTTLGTLGGPPLGLSADPVFDAQQQQQQLSPSDAAASGGSSHVAPPRVAWPSVQSSASAAAPPPSSRRNTRVASPRERLVLSAGAPAAPSCEGVAGSSFSTELVQPENPKRWLANDTAFRPPSHGMPFTSTFFNAPMPPHATGCAYPFHAPAMRSSMPAPVPRSL